MGKKGNKSKILADDIVEVEWVDSTSNDAWMSLGRHSKDTMIKCRSIGYLNRKDKKSVQILQSKGEGNNSAMGSLMIPKGCVIRIRKLK